MSKKTSVLYYIPEDGDEADHPNVMMLDKNASQVTLKDIKEAFPIPGTYYFRFKRTFKNSWIWFDVTEDSEVVPKFDGLIFVKATRLPASAAPKKSKPSVKKPASRPKPTKPAKQEPKKEVEEDFLHNIEMPSSTPEFVEPQQPEIDFFSPSSNTSNTPVTGDVFGEFDFPTAKPVDPWDAIKICKCFQTNTLAHFPLFCTHTLHVSQPTKAFATRSTSNCLDMTNDQINP